MRKKNSIFHKFGNRHKFLKNLKSQAALEFLTTYAWAFLVILIMIAALAYFGILSPSNLLPDRCNFGSEIECQDFQITYGGASAGSIDLKLKNSVGEPIVIESITLSSEGANDYLCTDEPGVPQTWGSGDVTLLAWSDCNSDDAGVVAGEKFSVDVTIIYYTSKSGSTFKHTVEGDFFASVN